MMRPYFGTAKTPYPNAGLHGRRGSYACCTGAGPDLHWQTVPGIPLELSCATKLAASAYGPGNPGPSICPPRTPSAHRESGTRRLLHGRGTGTCACYRAQPGWGHGPSTLAAFTATHIEVLPVSRDDPTATPLDWMPPGDARFTDGDLTPNDFDTDDRRRRRSRPGQFSVAPRRNWLG